MKPRIPNPRSKPQKFGMEKVQQRLINKKLKDNYTRVKYLDKIEKSIRQDQLIQAGIPDYLNDNWRLKRKYNAYDYFVKTFLKKDIIQIISDYVKKYKLKNIKIKDEGAGEGHFLAELKEKLSEKDIHCKTTATSLNNNILDMNANKIDKIKEGDITYQIPTEKYDFIFSLWGGTYYSIMGLQKEIILKEAYSLKKGGYCILSLKPSSKMKPLDFIEDKEFNKIKQAFKKRGFNAELFINKYINSTTSAFIIGEKFPEAMLVIERLK